MNKKKILEAVALMETEKGISREILTQALVDSFTFAFAKKIEDDARIDRRHMKSNSKNKDAVKLPDALVRVDVNLDKGKMKVFHQWLVVPEDEIQDDFIEISYDEAKEKNPKIKLGDYYEEEMNIDAMKDKDVGRFISCFKQKITKAEKTALLEAFENRIGTNVMAEVEKCDKYNVIVNLLGKTSATLYRNDLIGDERFQSGDNIKVYVQGIGKDDKRGSLIKVSRSCPEFLRELFKTEVHEIYDGTVEIKKIARIAGKRSKVCVYSADSNIDASGACIGQNGARIQEIVSILGKYTKDYKEKIDVITWSPNIGVFVSEILRPGNMLGLIVDEENSRLTAIVDDYNLGSAIGLGGINLTLCKQLTGYQNVDVISESDAASKGLLYKTIEEYRLEAEEDKKKEFRERSEERRALIAQNRRLRAGENVSKEVEDNYVPEETTLDDEVEETIVEVKPVKEVKEETEVTEAPKVEVEEAEVEEAEVEENNEEVAPKTVEVKPEELRDVKTTTTLESLEKSLEEEKERKAQQAQAKKKKKENKKVVKEEKEEKKNIVKMDIYTDEELAEFENELEENFDDEEDYSEYDSDDYYEDR